MALKLYSAITHILSIWTRSNLSEDTRVVKKQAICFVIHIVGRVRGLIQMGLKSQSMPVKHAFTGPPQGKLVSIAAFHM